MRTESQTVPAGCELLAPAGSWEALQAALSAGADSVYLGVGRLNMRARAALNFTGADLPRITRRCHKQAVKVYLTLNNVLYDEELDAANQLCLLAREAGVDAVICHDFGAIEAVQAAGLAAHLSTQANISNYAAVRFYARYADVMVLARELHLEQIRAIRRQVVEQELRGPSGQLVRLEAFIHGALCVAISGKCQMSLAQFNHSANRGDCLQSCRRSYTVRDTETGNEFVVDNQYVMSPKDLCTIGNLPALLGAGVSVLKIEGRGRPADYVATVVACYREALTAIADGRYDEESVRAWRDRLQTVFNRGFWEGGFYLGKSGQEWSGFSGNRATERKVKVGRVNNYFRKVGIAEIELLEGPVRAGDTLLAIGPATGAVRWQLEPFRVDEKLSIEAFPRQSFTCKSPLPLRRNDKVFCCVPAADFD